MKKNITRALFLVFLTLLPVSTSAETVISKVGGFPAISSSTAASPKTLESISTVQPVEDINGDGVVDVLMSSATISSTETVEFSQRFYVHYGQNDFSNLPNIGSADVVFEYVDSELTFTGTAIVVGDVNSDGLSDVLFTVSPSSDKEEFGFGYLYYGSSTLEESITISAETADVTIQASQRPDTMTPVAVGDLNNDGFDDVGLHILALPVDSVVDEDRYGHLHVFYGGSGASALSASYGMHEADMRVDGIEGNQVGSSIAVVDLDNDGKSDLAFAGVRTSEEDSDTGVSVLYNDSLSATTDLTSADTFLKHDAITRNTSRIWGIGDVNADGSEDLAIEYSGAETDDSPILLSRSTENRRTGTIDMSEDGAADITVPGVVRTGGDINNDGVDDVLFSQTGFVPGLYGQRGRSRMGYILNTGSLTGELEIEDAEVLFNSTAASQQSGPGYIGDFDDDGSADIMVVAPVARKTAVQFILSEDSDGDGVQAIDGDCRDADATISPTQSDQEINFVDDNCDGVEDDEYGYSFKQDGPLVHIRHHRLAPTRLGKLTYKNGAQRLVAMQFNKKKHGKPFAISTNGKRFLHFDAGGLLDYDDAYSLETVSNRTLPFKIYENLYQTAKILDVREDGKDELVIVSKKRNRKYSLVYLFTIRKNNKIWKRSTIKVKKMPNKKTRIVEKKNGFDIMIGKKKKASFKITKKHRLKRVPIK